jgi:hypothetical protein
MSGLNMRSSLLRPSVLRRPSVSGLVGVPSSSTGCELIDGVDVSMNGFLGATVGDVWCGKLAVCVTATGEIGCEISVEVEVEVVLVLMAVGVAGFVSAMLGTMLASALYTGKSREELEQFQAK